MALSHERPTARRVAALADVHGNADALEAVLAELADEPPDLVVFCGDLTWGSLPGETLDLVRSLEVPARFVRGNGDRAVGTLLEGRGAWMTSVHGPEDVAFLRAFEPTVTVEIEGLGPTCFCHGSPRSDIECVTERTPAERIRAFMEGRDERVVATAHVHVQYERETEGVRLLSPGSVGLPYEGQPGAYWALLGPDVELRRTPYDVGAAAERMRATDDPGAETIAALLLDPPAREEAIEHAERVEFTE